MGRIRQALELHAFYILKNACNLRLIKPRSCRKLPTPIHCSLQLLNTCSELQRAEFLSLNVYINPVNNLIYAVDFKLAYIILIFLTYNSRFVTIEKCSCNSMVTRKYNISYLVLIRQPRLNVTDYIHKQLSQTCHFIGQYFVMEPV